MPKKIVWSDRAKTDLRAIEQATALRILHALARVLATGEGDVKRLQDIDPPVPLPLATIACVSGISMARSKSSL